MIPSIRVWHEDLFAAGHEGPLSLSSLAPEQHIHGGLRIEIGGRPVPHLGFFGKDDVCFDTWVEELTQLVKKLLNVPEFTHVFDEGEQGQPAFVFERRGDKVFFSIRDSKFSGGKADPDWQEIEFTVGDFIIAYQGFVSSLLSWMRVTSTIAQNWLSKRMMAAANSENAPVLLDSEIWRDGGSLSATVADRGAMLSFWLQANGWDHPQEAGHVHLYVSKGANPTRKEKRVEIASTSERRWLALLRRAKIDLVEVSDQDHFKRLLAILHRRSC